MIVLLFLVFVAAFAFIGGFVWMICLGALSHIFGVEQLAIGFWPSVLVAFIFGALFGSGRD